MAKNVLATDTYTNPIIDADYSDPDVIRVGDDFYLTASSFNSIPGLPTDTRGRVCSLAPHGAETHGYAD